MSGTRTSDRGHLSIGEVLNLLQDEFPDITISKIRFLESQGLLDPERTPSGYRKFYETDITRLRWILTQQREHFLPLKVIKDRLDDGSFADDLPGHDGSEADRTDGVTIVDDGIPSDRAPRDDRPADQDITLHGVPSPVGSRAATVWGDGAASDRTTPGSGSGGDGEAAPSEADDRGVGTDGDPSADGDGGPAGSGANGDREELASVSPLRTSPDPVAGVAGDTPGGDEPGAEEPGAEEPAAALPSAVPAHDMFDGGVSSLSLSVEELCRATGLTARQIGELERFGLIESDQLGSTARYDETALVVARVAAQMMEHGVEVRHLRMFKLAAEREAAFYEQLVLPILKQRDPKARQAALDSLRVLAAGGDALRSSMLSNALRHLVNHA